MCNLRLRAFRFVLVFYFRGNFRASIHIQPSSIANWAPQYILNIQWHLIQCNSHWTHSTTNTIQNKSKTMNADLFIYLYLFFFQLEYFISNCDFKSYCFIFSHLINIMRWICFVYMVSVFVLLNEWSKRKTTTNFVLSKKTNWNGFRRQQLQYMISFSFQAFKQTLFIYLYIRLLH